MSGARGGRPRARRTGFSRNAQATPFADTPGALVYLSLIFIFVFVVSILVVAVFGRSVAVFFSHAGLASPIL